VPGNGRRTSRCSLPPLGHRSRSDAPPGEDEGATRRDALHRGAPPCTKASRGTRSPTDDHSSVGGPAREPVTAREDSRVTVVRPDQVSCCIVPAMSERSASFLLGAARASARSTPGFTQLPPGVGVTQRTKAPLAGVAPYRSRDARRIGLGSTGTRSLYRQRDRSKSDRGVRRGSSQLDSAGRKRPFRARAESTEARNGVVNRRPHRCSPPARVREGTRKPHRSGCPIDSREWAEVGRTHLWFVDLAVSQGRAGPPADLVTRALTRRATRARTGIHKMSVFGSPRGGSSRGE
jgi:hypothetical protein